MNKGNQDLYEICVDLVGGNLDTEEEMSFEEACKVYPKAWRAMAKENRRRMQEKGFWGEPDSEGDYPERNKGEMIALMHSELSECLEALRLGNKPDDKIPEFSGESAELADVQIRMLDYDGGDVNVGEAVVAKMKMNKGRKKKHGKAF